MNSWPVGWCMSKRMVLPLISISEAWPSSSSPGLLCTSRLGIDASPLMRLKSEDISKSDLKPPKASLSAPNSPLNAGDVTSFWVFLDQPTLLFQTRGALSLKATTHSGGASGLMAKVETISARCAIGSGPWLMACWAVNCSFSSPVSTVHSVCAVDEKMPFW